LQIILYLASRLSIIITTIKLKKGGAMRDLFKYKNKTVEILCDNGEILKGVVNLGCDINYVPFLQIQGEERALYPENVCKINIIKNCG
jgi:hypothetical protein